VLLIKHFVDVFGFELRLRRRAGIDPRFPELPIPDEEEVNEMDVKIRYCQAWGYATGRRVSPPRSEGAGIIPRSSRKPGSSTCWSETGDRDARGSVFAPLFGRLAGPGARVETSGGASSRLNPVFT
jgi:hypothetical protein